MSTINTLHQYFHASQKCKKLIKLLLLFHLLFLRVSNSFNHVRSNYSLSSSIACLTIETITDQKKRPKLHILLFKVGPIKTTIRILPAIYLKILTLVRGYNKNQILIAKELSKCKPNTVNHIQFASLKDDFILNAI
jgi:hypothetical protein